MDAINFADFAVTIVLEQFLQFLLVFIYHFDQ